MNNNALFRPGLGIAVGVWLALCGLPLPPCSAVPEAQAAAPAKKSAPQKAALSVYENQPPVTEKELLRFLDVLPQFRAWARAGNEEGHPILRNNKADFLYSPQAAAWVQQRNWDPVRFFCVMGRMAAALAIVEEGNEMGARSRDMPDVTDDELALARKHLGSILKAGSSVPPISR